MDTGICAWKKRDTQAKWSQRVAECRQSGLSVRQWCNEHGINPKTYYHWQRKLFLMAQEQAHVEFASVPVLQSDAESSVVATLRNGDFAVILYRGVDREAIQAICHALQSCLNDFDCHCPIYIACGYTGLRCGIDGLASIVQSQFQLDPLRNDDLDIRVFL